MASISYHPPDASPYRCVFGSIRASGRAPVRRIWMPVPALTTTPPSRQQPGVGALQRHQRGCGVRGTRDHRYVVAAEQPGDTHDRVARRRDRQLTTSDAGELDRAGRPVVGHHVPEQRGGGVAAVTRGSHPKSAAGAASPWGWPPGRRCREAGSWWQSQVSSGPAIPGTSGFESAPLTSGARSCQRPMTEAARRSGHSIAGRSGRPSGSVSTTPCICPLNPTAATCAPGDRRRASGRAGRRSGRAPGSSRGGRSRRTPVAQPQARRSPRPPRPRCRRCRPGSASGRWCPGRSRGRCRGSPLMPRAAATP